MEFDGEGRRKDGRPFKEGNTRDDGTYDVGKNRTPVSTRFAQGDGRARGRRAKGEKNFDTDWAKALTSTVTLKVNGKPTRMSAHKAQVMVTMDAGGKGNIKAQQIIYDKASRILAAKAERSVFSDDGIIEAWLAQRSAAEATGIVGDDDASVPDTPAVDAAEGPPALNLTEPSDDQ